MSYFNKIKGLFDKLSQKDIVKILLRFYLVGFLGLSIPYTRNLFIFIMAPTLLLTVAFLLFFHKQWQIKQWVLLSFIAVSGFLVEVAGVQTSLVFGSYQYGSALGFKLFDTPLMIGINWFMLVYCFWAIVSMIHVPSWLRVPLAATMMLVYDIILEPVAMRLDMWSWENDTIPLQNYLAWFVISLEFFFLLALFRIKIFNPASKWLIVFHTAFFIFLNISLRLF
ncbi:MAG: carotenoid biosynthesis protein [Bacteroidales bacterium]|nr:carotenoid biosynthesis protein [Bacteroidales bacterium]